MPPRPKVTAKNIEDAAFRLVRTRGYGALTAKSLAAEAGCSTQPVFWYFSGMAEVSEKVLERAKAFFAEKLRDERQGVNPFKTVGLNYIAFARDETPLFRLLYMSGKTDPSDLLDDENTPFAVDVIVKEKGVSDDDARRVFRELWLFSHGIATMIATGTTKFSEDEISAMLSDVYVGVLLKIGQEKDASGGAQP